MKKLLLIALLFAGCKNYSTELPIYSKDYGIAGSNIGTTNIEGCDYFVCRTVSIYYILSHKGNCSNPIYQYKDTCK